MSNSNSNLESLVSTKLKDTLADFCSSQRRKLEEIFFFLQNIEIQWCLPHCYLNIGLNIAGILIIPIAWSRYLLRTLLIWRSVPNLFILVIPTFRVRLTCGISNQDLVNLQINKRSRSSIDLDLHNTRNNFSRKYTPLNNIKVAPHTPEALQISLWQNQDENFSKYKPDNSVKLLL